MPGKAVNSDPNFADPSKDMTYRGHKDSQVLIQNSMHFTTPATEFAPNDEGGLCPASQTAAILFMPIAGLKIGDEIVGYRLIGYVTSAANTVTVDCALLKIPKAGTPADPTGDASNAITQVSETSTTTMDELATFTAPYVVVTDEAYNMVITTTTAASTTTQVVGVELIVNRK